MTNIIDGRRWLYTRVDVFLKGSYIIFVDDEEKIVCETTVSSHLSL